MFKLLIWGVIGYLGFRVWRNITTVWRVVKSASEQAQSRPPQGRQPVEAQFEVEEGK